MNLLLQENPIMPQFGNGTGQLRSVDDFVAAKASEISTPQTGSNSDGFGGDSVLLTNYRIFL